LVSCRTKVLGCFFGPVFGFVKEKQGSHLCSCGVASLCWPRGVLQVQGKFLQHVREFCRLNTELYSYYVVFGERKILDVYPPVEVAFRDTVMGLVNI